MQHGVAMDSSKVIKPGESKIKILQTSYECVSMFLKRKEFTTTIINDFKPRLFRFVSKNHWFFISYIQYLIVSLC